MTGPVNGQGGFGSPAPGDDPLIAAIRSLLPERTSEERSLGFVRVSFGAGEGAEAIRVPVLFHGPNQEWQTKVREAGSKLFADVQADDTGAVMGRLLTGQVDLQLDLLHAYNPQLLSREWLAANATEEQILDAFLGVVAAAFPTPVALARVLLANRQVAAWVRLQLIQALYTSSSQPNTGGRRKKSTKG